MFRGICLHLVKQNFSNFWGLFSHSQSTDTDFFIPLPPQIHKILEILTFFPLNYDL